MCIRDRSATDTTYSNFTTSSSGLVPVSPGGTSKYLRADGTWQEVSGGTTDLSNYVKLSSSDSTTINRTGSAYLTLLSDTYIQLSADQYVRIDGDQSVNINSSSGPLSVSVDSNIQLYGGGFVQTKGSYVDFQNVAGNASYGKFDSTGLNLYTGGIKDKDGQFGTAGQILSSCLLYTSPSPRD